MTDHKPAAYICTCTEAQLSAVGCDCHADQVRIVEVNTVRLDTGLYALSFNGNVRGDAAKFDFRDARNAAAAWDGKEDGEWVGSQWVPIVYRCAWGAGRAA